VQTQVAKRQLDGSAGLPNASGLDQEGCRRVSDKNRFAKAASQQTVPESGQMVAARQRKQSSASASEREAPLQPHGLARKVGVALAKCRRNW